MLRAIDLSPLAVAKRLGSHGENALSDVSRKALRLRIAKLFFRLRKLIWGGVPATLKPFLRNHDRPGNMGKALHSSPSPRTLVLEKLFLKYFHHNLRVVKSFVLGPLRPLRSEIP